MKKSILLILLLSLLTATTFGQVNCAELESQHEKLTIEIAKKEAIITTKNKTITNQKKDIKYLKEILELLNTSVSKESGNIIYRINSVVGKYDEGMVIIEGLIENKGVTAKFQPRSVEIYDPKGNIYKTKKSQIGNSNSLYLEELERGLPTKFSFEFHDVLEKIPV